MCTANFIFIWRQIYKCIYIDEATLNPLELIRAKDNICTFYKRVTSAAFQRNFPTKEVLLAERVYSSKKGLAAEA